MPLNGLLIYRCARARERYSSLMYYLIIDLLLRNYMRERALPYIDTEYMCYTSIERESLNIIYIYINVPIEHARSQPRSSYNL